MSLKWHHIDECNKNYQKIYVLTFIWLIWTHLNLFAHNSLKEFEELLLDNTLLKV
jgi:hypothetical protein